MAATADALRSSADAVFCEQWVDIGGQLMPATRLEDLVAAIQDGTISDLAALDAQWDRILDLYAEDEWAWVKWAYRKLTGVDVEQAATKDLLDVADNLQVHRKEFLEAVLVDAVKEFDKLSAVGFGTDGPPEANALDFQAVRGDYDSNKFVVQLRAEIEALSARVEQFKKHLVP